MITQQPLNRYLAQMGFCSRRKAESYILAGSVQVNGITITDPAYTVTLSDQVQCGSAVISALQVKKQYILLHKPKNYVTTCRDDRGRSTVIDLVSCKERLYPVGRLDRETVGLLLLTNDGALAHKMTHPRYEIQKVYEVRLDKPLQMFDRCRLLKGVQLSDGVSRCDAVHFPGENNKRRVIIYLHSGKNRIIRRIFERLGYMVVQLKRIEFGPLKLQGLSEGAWRELSYAEVTQLKQL